MGESRVLPEDPLYAIWPVLSDLDTFYSSLAKRHGESYLSQWALDEMNENPEGVTQKQLCVAMHAPKQTVNSIVSSLEKRGLVKTSLNENDRRSKIHTLTEAGKEKQRRVSLDMSRAVSFAVEGLTQEDLAQMLSTLQHITTRLNESISSSEESAMGEGR